MKEQERWAREWARVEEAFGEVRLGCGICWVVGRQEVTREEEQWKKHKAMQCRAWEQGTGAGADAFWRQIVDGRRKNNCGRWWVSRKYWGTGEGLDKRCQWGNVVVRL